MTYNQVIKFYGSEREAAFELKVSTQTLWNWKHNGINLVRQQAIELLTKGRLKADKVKK